MLYNTLADYFSKDMVEDSWIQQQTFHSKVLTVNFIDKWMQYAVRKINWWMKFIICVCFLRLMMQRVLWVLSSRPPSLTAAWQHSLVCPSKSSFCAPCQTGSKYVYACFFTWHAHLTLNIFYSVKFLCALIFCYFQLWPKLQYIFSISSQIDVCITPGTHASEEAGKNP